MRGPQIEDGYIRIANTLLEDFAEIPLSGSEWRVLFVVIRKTYGWNKKIDRIPLSQFERATGIEHRRLCRVLKGLVAKRALLKTNFCYSINKNTKEWVVAKRPLAKKAPEVVAKMVTGSGFSDTLPVAKRAHSKDTLSKDNSKDRDFSQNAQPDPERIPGPEEVKNMIGQILGEIK